MVDHLIAAGVGVTAIRYQTIVPDFVMFDVLRWTAAAEVAPSIAISLILAACPPDPEVPESGPVDPLRWAGRLRAPPTW